MTRPLVVLSGLHNLRSISSEQPTRSNLQRLWYGAEAELADGYSLARTASWLMQPRLRASQLSDLFEHVMNHLPRLDSLRYMVRGIDDLRYFP